MQGGLTLSGGEPLVQPAFSRRIFAAAKSYGLHTALDTSGFLGDRATDEYLQSVDLVLLDIKSWDPDTYRRVTKQDVAPTLRFAERLAAMGKPVWIRYVLVPGLTDDPANVEGVAKFVAPMKNVECGWKCCPSISSARSSGRNSAWSMNSPIRRRRRRN